jgi:hypothetical protein
METAHSRAAVSGLRVAYPIGAIDFIGVNRMIDSIGGLRAIDVIGAIADTHRFGFVF